MREKTFNIFDSSLSRKSNWESLVLLFLLFFLTNPYFFWQWYGNLFVSILLTTIAMLIIWKHTGRLTKKQKSVYAFYVIVWIIYLLNEFSKGARAGVIAYFPYVLLGIVPFVNKEFGKKVFSNFSTLYAILLGLSMIFWVAAMMGLISPIGQLGVGNESLEAQRKTYLVYPLALVSTSNIGEFTRFCGIFDEPGVVGTLSGLILCALRLNMRDWRCIIILLTGLLSTSMFFYGLIAVYWFGEYIFVRKKMGWTLMLFLGVSAFYVATKDNAVISSLVWERFEWDVSKGDFAGNSRGSFNSNASIQKITNSGEIWLGVEDKEAYWAENYGSSSIFDAFAMYGIVFVTLYVIWLLLAGYRYKVSKWDYLLFCFVVIGCLYQRPNLFNLPYTFLFTCVARYYEFQLSQNGLPRKKTIRQLEVTLNSKV